jgi:hypothetical protein
MFKRTVVSDRGSFATRAAAELAETYLSGVCISLRGIEKPCSFSTDSSFTSARGPPRSVDECRVLLGVVGLGKNGKFGCVIDRGSPVLGFLSPATVLEASVCSLALYASVVEYDTGVGRWLRGKLELDLKLEIFVADGIRRVSLGKLFMVWLLGSKFDTLLVGEGIGRRVDGIEKLDWFLRLPLAT